MDNDYLVVNYKISFFKSKLFDWKVPKIDDVMGLSPNHVFSSNNGHKYYICINFKVFCNTNK